MKLKTKLTLSIALLVLLVVLAVNLVTVAGVVRQQMQDVYSHADFVARGIYNEMSQELGAASAAGKLGAVDAAGLRGFLQGLQGSPALATLLSSAIGYNGAIRDVALVAPDGTVAVDSNPLLEGQRQPQRRLMSEVLQGGLGTQLAAIFGRERIYTVSLATSVGNQPLGTIAIGVDTVLLRQAVVGRIEQSALYGGLIVLLATGLAWGLSDLALSPLAAISAQLDRLTAAPAAAAAAGTDEFGLVQSKIQRLGREMEDARQVYSTLQENVSHVLEGLEEGLLLFDAQGQSVMASAATPRLLGLGPGEVVGRAVEELFPGESGLDRGVRLAVRQKVAMASREAERHAGGRPLLARLDLVRDRGGQMGALLTLRDAEPVYRLENELEVARRLSAVGRLTRGVAHEVKNPLNAMAIHVDLLQTKAGGGGNGLAPHIEVIRREIERLNRVVGTFLDFSRPVELQLAPADLSEVARGVEQLVQAGAAAQGIAIALAAPRPGPRAWLDRDLVEQALLNLVNNGLQAMTEASAGGGERELRLEVFEEEQQGVIRVRDQGPGVPAEHRDKIFDLYFTTRSEGTGIGLATAARIMQLHQGAIELEPGAGAGASFVLRFPLRGSGAEG
ncbi:MAG TPA: ATP-binding protein [Terriglobales bacterium]|nr:ATP-binding protein [Terriglobales bacterium]